MKRLILHIDDWEALSQIVWDRWKTAYLSNKKFKPFWAELTTTKKTHEQLGYLHSTVLPVLTECLSESGEIRRKNEREAKYWLKRFISYGEHINYNGGIVFDANSFEKASKDILTLAIDEAITQCEQRGYYVPLPKVRKVEKK